MLIRQRTGKMYTLDWFDPQACDIAQMRFARRKLADRANSVRLFDRSDLFYSDSYLRRQQPYGCFAVGVLTNISL